MIFKTSSVVMLEPSWTGTYVEYPYLEYPLRGRPEAKFQKNEIIVSYPFYHTQVLTLIQRLFIVFFLSYHTLPHLPPSWNKYSAHHGSCRLWLISWPVA